VGRTSSPEFQASTQDSTIRDFGTSLTATTRRRGSGSTRRSSARHVKFWRARTDDGEKVVWELRSDQHGRATVWVEPANLVAKVRVELSRRKAKDGEPRLKDGERVRLNPGTKRPSKRTAGQTVWPFPLFEFEHGLPDHRLGERSSTPARS
jgi:hypothetical protein